MKRILDEVFPRWPSFTDQPAGVTEQWGFESSKKLLDRFRPRRLADLIWHRHGHFKIAPTIRPVSLNRPGVGIPRGHRLYQV